MGRLDSKEQILRQAGYAYSFDRMVYFNSPPPKAVKNELEGVLR